MSIHNAMDTDSVQSDALVKDDQLRPIVVVGLLIGALVFGAADGYIAYFVESPGTSLAGDCLLVAAIAVVVTAFGWILLRSKWRKLRVIFATSVLIVGLLATWWAWAFAMPAAIRWSNATTRALSTLNNATTGRTSCINVAKGSIGPLPAPYQECAERGQSVVFTAQSAGGTPDDGIARGLIFTETASNGFSDSCIRHLGGDWYAFTDNPSGTLGYTCQGGG